MDEEKQIGVRTWKRKTFGQTVQELRQRANMTQEDLAYISGITRRQINRIEADQCEPTIKTVAKLEKALRLPEMTLLELKQKEEGNLQHSNETEEKIVRAFRDLERELLINMTELELQNVSGAINAITDLIKK
ncbi:MAG: helix-turn-helix domain-containing protein [bacterium]|nr:helix-turn-helix domain-containing protein [bacterium]